MQIYKVYYDDTCIGKLCIDENNQYKYVTDKAAIESLEKETKLIADVKTDKVGEPISFFKVRIETCNRYYGKSEKIAFPNSKYYLIKE